MLVLGKRVVLGVVDLFVVPLPFYLIYSFHMLIHVEKPCDAKRKKMELWTAVSGLLSSAEHTTTSPSGTLKATRSRALVVLMDTLYMTVSM